MPLRLPRRRTLGWITLGGVAGYALAWLAISAVILLVSETIRISDRTQRPAPLPGVHNFARVDDRVWRGAAPTTAGYRALAERGVRTVVDLRAEKDVQIPREVTSLGLTVLRLPVRDGQTPTATQVDRFLAVVREAQGPVFVHCGAGVGRTGSMAAAYLVATGQADAVTATRRSLAVGPPSLEQIAFMRGLRGGRAARPPVALVALSRVADSPRRLWSRLRR
ncbi:protein-tyrosine phosphatase family protein [Actinomadura hibisca]|uniref:protein-tyrosine phosphatase family protein n=1 Tax=Actinomadura hibisca TaxID=68565 RepID=UPI00082C62DC|nr:tyrosine-protein phosphatase [Actinomadura hibisca]